MLEEITLRTAKGPTDERFAFDVYRGAREDETAQFGWSIDQVEAFLRMQFNAREQAYRLQFPNLEDSVIFCGSKSVGRLLVERNSAYLLLVDIAILPGERGKGIASHLVERLKRDAATESKPLILRVDKNNGVAIALYKRLGGSISRETDLMFEFEWRVEVGKA